MPSIPPIGGLTYSGKRDNDPKNTPVDRPTHDGSDSHQEAVDSQSRRRHPQEEEGDNIEDEGSSVRKIRKPKRNGDSSSITSASTATSTATSTSISSKSKRHTRSNQSKENNLGKESEDGGVSSKSSNSKDSNGKHNNSSNSTKRSKNRKKKDRSTSTSSTRSTSTTISLKSHLEANNNIKKVGGACGGNTSAGASVDENKTIKTSNINASTAASAIASESASAGGSKRNTASDSGVVGLNDSENYHSNGNNISNGNISHHTSDRRVNGSAAAKKARAEAIAIAKAQLIANAKAKLNSNNNYYYTSENKQDGKKSTTTTIQDYSVSKDYRVSDLSCIDEAETTTASEGKNNIQQQEQRSSESIGKQKETQSSFRASSNQSNSKINTSSSPHRSSPSRSPPGFFTKTRPHSTTPIPVIPANRYSLSGSSRSSQSHGQSLASSHSQSLSSHSKSLSSSHGHSFSSSHSQSITSSSHSQSVTSTHSYNHGHSQSGSMRFTFGETTLEAEENASTVSPSSLLNLPEVSPISTSSALLAAESTTAGGANYYPKSLLRQSTTTVDSDNNNFGSLVSSPTSAFVAVPPRTPTPVSVSKTASNATAKTGETTLSSFETNYHERRSTSSNGFDQSEDDLQSLTSLTSLTSLKSFASLNSGLSNSHANSRSSHGNDNSNGKSKGHSFGHSSSTSIRVSHEVQPQHVAEVADKIQRYMDFKENRQKMESEAIIARLKANPAGCGNSSAHDVGKAEGSACIIPLPVAPPFPSYWGKRETNNGDDDEDDDFNDTEDIHKEYNNSSISFMGPVDEFPTAEQVQLRVKLRKERRRNSSSNSNKSGLSGLSGLSGSNRSGVSECTASVISPASGVSGISGNGVGGIVDLSVRKEVGKQKSHSLRSGIGGMSGVDYSSARSDSEFSSQGEGGVESGDGGSGLSREKKGSPYNEDSIMSLSHDKVMGSGAETKLCSSRVSVGSSRDDGDDGGKSYQSSASTREMNLTSSSQGNSSWRSLSSCHNYENDGSIGSEKIRKAKSSKSKAEGLDKLKGGFMKKRSSSISAAYEAAVVAKGGSFFDEAVSTLKRRGSTGYENLGKGRKRDESCLSNSFTEGSVVSSGSNNVPVSFLTTVSSRRTRDTSVNSHGGASVMSNVSGLSWGSLRIFHNKNSKGTTKRSDEKMENELTASGVSESSSRFIDDANKGDDVSVASDKSNGSKSLKSGMSLKSNRSTKSLKSNRSTKSLKSNHSTKSPKSNRVKSSKKKGSDSDGDSKSGKSSGSVAGVARAGSSKKKKSGEWESPQEQEEDEDENDSDDGEGEDGAAVPITIISNNNFVMRTTNTTAASGTGSFHEQRCGNVISPIHWSNNETGSAIDIVGTSEDFQSNVGAQAGVIPASHHPHAQSQTVYNKNAPSGILRGDGRYSPNGNFMEVNREHSTSRIKSILRGVQNRRDCSSDRNADTRSESSHKSKSSVLSSITATSTKLKRYLKLYRRRSSHSNEPHDRPSHKRQGKSNRSEQSPGEHSRSKVAKYRPPNHGPHHAMNTHMQRHHSTYNYVGNTSVAHDFHNNNSGNEGMKNRVKFHDNCSVALGSTTHNYNDRASVVTTRSASSMNSLDRRVRHLNAPNGNGITTKVFDLPWYDGRPNGIKGRYSGPVNAFLQPHGQGIIFLEGNNILQFHGYWKNGALISSLSSHGILSPSAGLDQMKSEKANNIQRGNKSVTATRDKLNAKDTLLDTTSTDESPQSSTCSIDSNDEKSSEKLGSHPTARGGRQKPVMKYSLGDVARTPRDMVIHRSNKEAIQSASMIKKFQQCFIKRSNGLWTVAILADLAMQPTNQLQFRHDDSIQSFSSTGQQHDSTRWYTPDEIDDSMELEQSMLFVINSDGATKIIQKRHWGKYIRRLNDGSAVLPEQESKKKEIREEGKF